MEREIQPADPRLRRRALAWTLLAALAGAALILLLESRRPELERWLNEHPLARARLLLRGVAVALALPLLLGARRAARLGRRTLETERFPPPGLAVVRDTPVRRGAAARRWGQALRGIALALGLLAASAALLLLHIAERLG